MRAQRLLAPMLALGLAVTGLPAFAAPGVAGSYAISTAESDDVNKAIEKAIAPMNMVVRTVARGRLEKVNHPYQHVTIATGSTLSVTTDGRAPITGASGSPIKWTRPEDGEKLDVTLRASGNELVETFSSPDGKRVNTFDLAGDGKKLVMTVKVTSPRLPQPLTYKITYKREK